MNPNVLFSPNFTQYLRSSSTKAQMLHRPFVVRHFVHFGLLLSLGLVLLLGTPAARAEGEAPGGSVWLPLVQRGQADDTGGGGDKEPAPPPPGPKTWAIVADTQWQTASADIARDSQGGLHLGYLYYEAADGTFSGENPPTYGVYMTCPADCGNGDNWSGVSFGELVNEIQVALTPANQPRVLYRTVAGDGSTGYDYFYAECNQDCANPRQWGVVPVATARGTTIVNFNDDHLPQRYFALDPQGRPRFVYDDRDTFREPDHLGVFYAYCDQDCTDSANWFETRINQDNSNEWNYRAEKFYYPALTFDAAGRPHIAADGVSMQDEFFLYYVTCAGGCEATANWVSTPLAARGSGPKVSYDIAVTGAGAPRIAFFEGAQLEGKGERLAYLWCNTDCTNSGSWERHELGLGLLDGQSPALKLDQNGRPHIAYTLHSVGGLGYSQCTANCESAHAQWQHEVPESGSHLASVHPVVFPKHCDGGIWNGLMPTLELEPSGSAIVGYDTTFHARCWYNVDTGEWKPWNEFHLIMRTVRVVYLP